MRGCVVVCLVVSGSIAIVRAQDPELITLAQRVLVASRDRARVKPAIYAIFAATGDAVTRFNTLREWVVYVRLHRR